MDYKKTAVEILEYVGGEQNVTHLEHCSTRLRFTLADSKKADMEKLKKIKGVMGVVITAQCQIVIGNDVIEVFDEINKIASFNGSINKTIQNKEKKDFGSIFIDFIIGVFQPLVPAIAGAGILKAMLSMLKLMGLMDGAGVTYQVFSQIADSALYFLPLMVAVTTATKLKCNKLVALAAVGTLILPNMTTLITSGAVLWGFEIKNIAYTYQVFPAILAVLLLSAVEKAFQKISPKPIRVFFVPMMCFLIVVPITLLVLGPIGFTVGQGLTAVILFLYEKLGWIAVAILAALLPFMIATGMHKALVPYAISSITEMGVELLYLPASLAHNISEGGACFAVAIRTKDKDTRSAAISAGISAIFGITEPALYGITLQRKKALAGVVVGGFAGGLIVGIVGLKAFVAMGPGLAGMAMFIDPDNGMNIIWAFAGLGVSLVVSFLVTFILYRETKEMKVIESGEELVSPMSGNMIAMEEVKDAVFSAKIIGDGVAITPDKGEIYAPADGKIEMVLDTKHAINMTTSHGAELLIHVGIDTVKLEGKGFEPVVKAGDVVKAGQLLMKFDFNSMKQAGYDMTTPIVITNMGQYTINNKVSGMINVGDIILNMEVK